MPAYFDHNATTPLCPPAQEAWLKASRDHWHNASSLYREAGFTAQKLDAARERLGDLLGCEATRIVFTSGASESNNALMATRDGLTAISSIEHPSLREAARHWLGCGHVEIPVNEHGIVTTDAVAEVIKASQPALITVMAANNESGTLQPWREINALCHQHGIAFHTDAAQWLGKLPAHHLGECDYITGSAHKFGGPKGIGFLVLRDEDECLRFLRGGPQESGRRAGTENYPGIEAMVTPLEFITPQLDTIAATQVPLRNAFEHTLRTAIPDVRVIGEQAPRLWNTSLLVMPRHDNLKWLTRLSRLGFAISTGSACSSGKEGSSVVVTALGATPEELRRVVRVSSGWQTTAEHWQSLASAFVHVLGELDAGGKPQ
jgi:cysteine desulfurase